MILIIGVPQWKIYQWMKMIANPPSPIIMKQSGSHYYIIFSNQRSHHKQQYCYMCQVDTDFTAKFQRLYGRLPIPTCLFSPNISFTYTLFFRFTLSAVNSCLYSINPVHFMIEYNRYIVMTTPKIIQFSI